MTIPQCSHGVLFTDTTPRSACSECNDSLYGDERPRTRVRVTVSAAGEDPRHCFEFSFPDYDSSPECVARIFDSLASVLRAPTHDIGDL